MILHVYTCMDEFKLQKNNFQRRTHAHVGETSKSNLLLFFRMAYLNAWLTSFVGYTLLCSLLGWTTRGRHHTPVFRMFDWPLHRDFSLLFAIGEVGSFTCIGCDSPIHGTDGLESPPKDLAMRIKRLAKGRYCRGGIWTHAEPPVWKFAVYGTCA